MALSLPQIKWIPVSFGLAAVLFVFNLANFFQTLPRFQETTQWVEHSYQVIASLEKIRLDLRDMERGVRGYLLSPQPEYLHICEGGIKALAQDMEKGRQLTSDNPAMRKNFALLEPLIANKLSLIQGNLTLCREGRFPQAIRLFHAGKGRQAMERIDSRIREMETLESGLLADRKGQAGESSRKLIRTMVPTRLLMGFFLMFAFFLMVRQGRERARYLKIMAKNEHQLFQFLEAVPVGIFVLDQAGKPFYANQVAKNILGKSVAPDKGLEQLADYYQVYLAGTDQLLPAEKLPAVTALAGEKAQAENLEIHRPDKIIPLQVWSAPIFGDQKEVKYAVVTFADITDRKEIDEMKNELISVVSHQLKTPVGEINGYIANMLEGLTGPLTDKQRDYLFDMRDIGTANYELICNLLNASKIERGVLSVELKPVALKTIVELSLRDYIQKIEDKGLVFRLEKAGGDLLVQADMEKTAETVRNLLNNALKCTDKGTITVAMGGEGGFGLILVKDTGVGMNEDTLGRLFKKSRVMGSESARSGAGIGLYIAENFMKLQGGSIAVASQAGQGSTFTLKIPKA